MESNCTLSLIVEPLSKDEPVLSIIPVVNGVKLTELVERFERSKNYEPAGGYAGLIPTYHDFGDMGEYFTGQSPKEEFRTNDYYLLGCSCGEVGCWPLLANIVRSGTTIAWQNFHQPFRPERDYSSFGPFVFDLDYYARAVADLSSALRLSQY